ncbi:hypothetical protein [Aminobacter sp. MET-1]|uniref:hypothetical protein n=1 Tax=Aminobacter sp. MET-1 TaxID=2951085 RepID=UPI00226A7456|nr:hypothetical protein [Aminobacter sp. MET-1]MCX8571159.1 hypothetical protein [Aminobacter sp. MET-1]MCX8573343.1 hypothetical protein [Aminobacter sp. MET-1]
MTTVFSTTIESEGYELEQTVTTVECPSCRGCAIHRFYESAEGGSINAFTVIHCEQCDYYRERCVR